MTKTLGILGGLGPMASAHFLETVVRMTQAETDQQHLEVLLHNVPRIPDRTAYLLDASRESPVPELVRVCRKLEAGGAQVLAVPCVTCHCFYEEMAASVSVPILHAVEETADYLQQRGIRRVGILATEGTLRSGLFARALEARGMEAVLPPNPAAVMQLIYGSLKSGEVPAIGEFFRQQRDLETRGAEVTILGCTELSLLKPQLPPDSPVLDVSEVLAKAAIEYCGAKVRPEFRELLGKRGL